MAEKAMRQVLIVRMRRIRSNAASMDGAAGRASLMTSPSTSCFSNWPRGGSGRRKARNATSTIGMESVKKAHRQPFGPPTVVAIRPTRSGLRAVAAPRPIPMAA